VRPNGPADLLAGKLFSNRFTARHWTTLKMKVKNRNVLTARRIITVGFVGPISSK
jgi:hypothetical protein